MIELTQINIVVRDMAAAEAFYRLLGVDIADTFVEWQPHHREVRSTGTDLTAELDSAAFAAMWNQGWTAERTGVVIGFKVDSRAAVDELYGTVISAGHHGQQPPVDAFWGARYAVVEDPDGNAVGLMSPIDEDFRTAPPDPP